MLFKYVMQEKSIVLHIVKYEVKSTKLINLKNSTAQNAYKCC